MSLSSNVWSRTRGTDEISTSAYNLIFALTTVFGLLVFGLAAYAFLTAKLGLISILLLFGVSMAGCWISASSEEIPGNLFGLTLIAGGLGAICGPFFNLYKVASIIDISGMTMLITLILGGIGWMYPKSLESWGSTLFSLLTALIIAQIFAALFFPFAAHTFLDWCGVLLFSGYIVYDFNKTQHLAKTTDNAMDSGVSVFLDIANLLIRLMSIFGDRK